MKNAVKLDPKEENEITVLKAHAKVNLFLYVGKKDAKGYHQLKTVFQPLDLHDSIIIKRKTGKEGKNKNAKGIEITSNEHIPLDERNSVYRAIKKICEKTRLDINKLKYEIHIEKNIPIASGLGGSAVDAAPVLSYLNDYYSLGLNENELNEIASEIGADVPQAFYRCTTYAERYGDVIIEKYKLATKYVVLYIPYNYMKDTSKTATLYNLLDEEKKKVNDEEEESVIKQLSEMRKYLKRGDWNQIGRFAYNDFERVAFKLYPILMNVKRLFLETGAICSLLSGSGGSVFGIYNTPAESSYAATKLEEIIGRKDGKIILTETL